MSCSRVIQASIFLALLSGQPALAATEPDLAQQLDSLFLSLPHAIFEWAEAEGVSERAAMRFPVTLDGTEGSFQLDTGLDVTLLYGDIATERGWETHDGMYHAPSFKIGGIDLGPTWLRTDSEAGSAGQVRGSIALDLLVGYLVLIDYPGQRFALLRHGQAPLWLLQRATWTPAKLRHAKFFLYAGLAGEGVDDLFFDTGASAFDTTVDFETWRELTGCEGPDDASIQWKVNSWGEQVTMVGAPAQGPLVIGSARIQEPRVFYMKEKPTFFADWPFPANGLVGNAPFWDRVVIMDLGMRPRFGLLQ